MNVLRFFSFVLWSSFAFAQVGIGTVNPDPAAVLDINAALDTGIYGGLKLPTVTLAQRATISSPIPDGLMVYLVNGTTRCVQIYDAAQSSWQNFYCMNQVPVASTVAVTGIYEVEEALTGTYTYTDVEGDVEGTSLIQWYRADDAMGTNATAIAGATTNSYTLVPADAGFYISYEVTPVAATGAQTGSPVRTAYSLVSFKDVEVNFDQQMQVIAENAASDDVQLSFTLSNISYSPVTLTVTASDYSRLNETAAAMIVIPANATSPYTTTVAPFNIDDNAIIDGTANITFTITAISGGTGTISLGTTITDTLEINDDDGVTSYVLANWDFNGNTGSEASVAASLLGSNVNSAVITRGTGISAALNANRFNANGYTQPDIAGAVANNDYIEFTVTPNSTLTVNQIDFLFERSGTGPPDAVLRSNADGFTGDLATFTGLATASNETITISSINNFSGTLIFRLYLFGNNNGGGTAGFEGSGPDLIITGSAL